MTFAFFMYHVLYHVFILDFRTVHIFVWDFPHLVKASEIFLFIICKQPREKLLCTEEKIP